MESRKYSTGTKGRIKMHRDKCREFIQANTSFQLAREFIGLIDPTDNELIWQRFQNVEEILPELQAWLEGSDDKSPATPSAGPPVSRHPEIKTGRQVLKEGVDAALRRTRDWLASTAVQADFAVLTPTEAAETALKKFYAEMTGVGPQ